MKTPTFLDESELMSYFDPFLAKLFDMCGVSGPTEVDLFMAVEFDDVDELKRIHKVSGIGIWDFGVWDFGVLAFWHLAYLAFGIWHFWHLAFGIWRFDILTFGILTFGILYVALPVDVHSL